MVMKTWPFKSTASTSMSSHLQRMLIEFVQPCSAAIISAFLPPEERKEAMTRRKRRRRGN